MPSKQQSCNPLSRTISGTVATALALVIVLTLAAVLGQSAQAQTFQVLYSFTGGLDGVTPSAGITLDAAGNLYGTTYGGGSGYGTVFKLSNKGSGWILTPLYAFHGGADGAFPLSRMIFGPDGTLYGTTSNDSECSPQGCGTVFNLRPATVCPTQLCAWTMTVLHAFTGGSDGAIPQFGDLVFDQVGSLYGTTPFGGINDCDPYGRGCGVVYKLTPSSGGWTESIVYSFNSGGTYPYGGVIFDRAGNLYGMTYVGGAYGLGEVFQLTPSGSGWTENVLHSFHGLINALRDGAYPVGSLVSDEVGNLYGTTSEWDSIMVGTVFGLTPSSGDWAFTPLYTFPGSPHNGGPFASLTMDTAGNLYGTTLGDGAFGLGNVFKLTPASGGWAYTDLHDFTGGSDGAVAVSSVTFDADGNLYGTTEFGGAQGLGVVWEITP